MDASWVQGFDVECRPVVEKIFVDDICSDV